MLGKTLMDSWKWWWKLDDCDTDELYASHIFGYLIRIKNKNGDEHPILDL